MYPNLDKEIKLQEISQAKLARLLGMTRQAMNQKFKGTSKFTTHEKIVIAKLLKKSRRYLYATNTQD